MTKQIIASLAAGVALTALAQTAHAQASASPYTSATRYDPAGRVTGTISPNSPSTGTSTFLATRTTYDLAGRPIKVENGSLATWPGDGAPASWSSFTTYSIYTTTETAYDAMSRKTREWVKGSDLITYSLTQYSYDSYGRLECTAVRMNAAIYGSLPASACTLGTEGSYGPDRITRNVYDAAGQLLQVREGVGTAVEAAEVTNTYTGNGKLQYVIDGGGNRAELRYDGHDRQVRWVFPSATKPGSFNDSTPVNALASSGSLNEGDYELYAYDNNGNRTSLRKRDGSTLTYTFDNINRMTVKVVPGSTTHTRDVYYSYDLRGLMTTARFDGPSGEGVTLGYDGFGRKTSETLVMDGASRTVGSQYDRDGALTQLTYPDGNYVAYVRDGLDRLYYAHLNGSPLFYPPYDAAGRVSTLYRLSTATANWSQGTGFAYDAVSRLASQWHSLNTSSYNSTSGFGYNPAGQITSRTRDNDAYAFTGSVSVNRDYTVNGLNQYSAVAGTGFAYDANGNLTSDGINIYSYDIENRLVARTGGGSATLRYDPLGRLYEIGGPITGMLRFVYDGDALVAEYDTAGNLYRRYIHGADEKDDPLVWFEGASVADSARRYLYSDERGSVAAVTDSSGNAIAINTYDEYGIPGAGNLGRFQYTGQQWLPDLGMYYYKARIYSPTLGRFVQNDPIGYDDQYNLYAYAGNDPINGVDYSGKCVGPLAIPCVIAAEEAISWGAAAATGIILWATSDGPSSNEPVPASDRDVSRNDNGPPPDPSPRVSAPPISPQKQAGHVRGTPQHANRTSQGKPTSTFFDKGQGEAVTRDTHQTGSTVPGRPGVKEKEYEQPVGKGPKGGTQNRVRTHEDRNGRVHGHPCGPETPCK